MPTGSKTLKTKPFKKKRTFLSRIIDKKKTAGALLALFLGAFGAHRYYYNDYNMGYIMLGISSFGITLLVGGLVLISSLAVTPIIGALIAGVGFYLLVAMIWWGTIDFFRILFNRYPKNKV